MTLRSSLAAPLALAAGIAVAVAGAASAGAGPLQIRAVRGSVVRLGSLGSGANGSPLYGVRLHATVCLGSAADALRAYPSAIGVTHFYVSRSPRRWWPAREVVDHAPWLVPLGERWRGKRCGDVSVDDPIPPTHYGVESLGNSAGCYGVELSIAVGARRASKRAIVTCGRRFG